MALWRAFSNGGSLTVREARVRLLQKSHRFTKRLSEAEYIAANLVVRIVSAVFALALPAAFVFQCSKTHNVTAVSEIYFID